MYIYSFEKLNVWKESVTLIKKFYQLTNRFPSDERFGLISQMKYSAISIASNISEGTSKNTKKDRAYFTTLAYSLAIELLNQLITTRELQYANEKGIYSQEN